jgi:protein-S-isoprenylcysteine O-methyltransferase Ste14
MGDTSRDAIDHHRTTQPRAGESMKNPAKLPGFVFIAVAVVAFVVCLASFALKQVAVGIAAIVVTLLAAGAAMAWLAMEARRIRQVQRECSSTDHGAME